MAEPGTRTERAVSVITHDFADAESLALALANTVARNLREAIARRGVALIAVSGGNTPRRFLEVLAAQSLDWSRVIVTVTDERWVPPSDSRSNEHMVRERLLKGPAANAKFVSMVSEAASPEDGLAAIAARFSKLPMPFDAVVLGMGNDAHCASLFPGGDHLAEALKSDADALVLPMRAPAAPEPRITLTLAALTETHAMYLLIEGPEKKAALERCLKNATPFAEAPVRAVLETAHAAPHVFWSP